jgi:hypothetical protein
LDLLQLLKIKNSMNSLVLGKEYHVGEWFIRYDYRFASTYKDHYILDIKPIGDVMFSDHKGWKYNFKDRQSDEILKIGSTRGLLAKRSSYNPNKICKPSRLGEYRMNRNTNSVGGNSTNEFVKANLLEWLEYGDDKGCVIDIYATPLPVEQCVALEKKQILEYFEENDALPLCHKNFN